MSLGDWDLLNYGMQGATRDDYDDVVDVSFPDIDVFDPDLHRNLTGDILEGGINLTQCLCSAGGRETVVIASQARSLTMATDQMRGRITTQIRLHPIAYGPLNAGVYCLGNQASLEPEGGGQGFALLLDTINAHEFTVCLVQLNDGISSSIDSSLGSTYNLLARTAAGIFTPGRVQFLRLDWETDLPRHKGVRLAGYWREGTGPLHKLCDITYTGAQAHKPTSNEATGVFTSASTNDTIVFFDNTQILIPEG